jgi:hypothetical protein
MKPELEPPPSATPLLKSSASPSPPVSIAPLMM